MQAGRNIRVTGNTIDSVRNAAVMITQDRGRAEDLVFSENAADGGTFIISIAAKTYGPLRGVVIVDNTFGGDAGLLNCAIIAAKTTRRSWSCRAMPSPRTGVWTPSEVAVDLAGGRYDQESPLVADRGRTLLEGA